VVEEDELVLDKLVEVGRKVSAEKSCCGGGGARALTLIQQVTCAPGTNSPRYPTSQAHYLQL
jgi:hypothetical protein